MANLYMLEYMHPWIGQLLVCHFKLWQREAGRWEPEVRHRIVPFDNVVYAGQYKSQTEPDAERTGKEYHQLVTSAGAQEKVMVCQRVKMLVHFKHWARLNSLQRSVWQDDNCPTIFDLESLNSPKHLWVFISNREALQVASCCRKCYNW